MTRKAQVEALVGHVPRQEPLLDELQRGLRGVVRPEQGLRRGLLLQRLHEADLIREEHETLVVGVAVGVQMVELLEERVLADTKHRPLLAQVLVVLAGGDVVVLRDLAQVGVGAGLRPRILRRVALKEHSVAVLRHEVKAALPELLQQRSRAHHAGLPVGPGLVNILAGEHDAVQLGQVRRLQPQAVLGDDEAEEVAGGLDLELHLHLPRWSHAPKLVREIQVALLRDGERGQPLREEGDLPRVGLPGDLGDVVGGPLLLVLVPERDGRTLLHDAVSGHLILYLARLHGGVGRLTVGAGVGQPQQLLLLPWRRHLPDGPALDPLAEGRDREEVRADHAADGPRGVVLAVSTVVRRVERAHADALTHRLQRDRLREVQADLDLGEVDLLGAEALRLQVAPEADLHLVVLAAPGEVHLGVRVGLLLLDVLQQERRGLVDLVDFLPTNRPHVVHAPLLPGDVVLLLRLAPGLHQIPDDLLRLLTLLDRVLLHPLRGLLLDRGDVGRDLALEGHVRAGRARDELLPVYSVLELALLVLQALLALALLPSHYAALLLEPLSLQDLLLGVELHVEAVGVLVGRVHLQLVQAVLLLMALLVLRRLEELIFQLLLRLLPLASHGC
mmetsp:Transcript_20770/g.61866  ORF Transcript_20770/g.61866 Transcript_20770/m.61866 type:complete len:617 (+) Transcript_20770:282-2132(+)